MPPIVFIYGGPGPFPAMCRELCLRLQFGVIGVPSGALLAIAPRLTRKLSRQELSAPKLGTLVFHPSALPYRRGPDAIRHAVAAGERVTAATWFWANEDYDAGPICEQEVVVLRPGESAGRAYHSRFIPAGIRALERALRSIRIGRPNRFAQEAGLETFDGPFLEKHPVELMGP